jgi:hypothetical protein
MKMFRRRLAAAMQPIAARRGAAICPPAKPNDAEILAEKAKSAADFRLAKKNAPASGASYSLIL